MNVSSHQETPYLSAQDAGNGFNTVLESHAPRLPSGDIEPEYGSVKFVARLFGLSPSRVWELIRDNEIRSFSDRKRGNIRGKRHILISSVRDRFQALSASENNPFKKNP